MGERSCHPEGEGRDLSQKVDEMMTMLQTVRMETAEMKNMLSDTLNNNKENDEEEVSQCHRNGTMTQYSLCKLLLSWIISFFKFLKTALPFRSLQEEATMMRSERIGCRRQEERRNLSEEVDELRTEFQTMRSEIAEMKNMLLTDAINKNNKENDDEEVGHRGTSSQFSFSSAAATAASTTILQQQHSFDGGPHFTFGSASYVNNDQMQQQQQQQPVQSNFVFGASTPTAASPFQFGSQQNIAPQNSPFQPSGSLEFNATGGSFSLGTGGGGYKFGRKYVKVQRKPRKK